jgi:hypothetical protein
MFKAGTVEFSGDGIGCNIKNLLDTGAALEILSPLYIPDRFTLFAPSDQFHVVWRKERRLGIAFD